MKKEQSRRSFIKTGSLAAAGFMIIPRHVLGGKGFIAPSDQLVVAGIGVGGKGEGDLLAFHESGKAAIAYLCDVDEKQAANSFKRFPQAKRYKDFREMLEKEHRHIDAVSVSSPDHNHAIQALAAMQLGKHVYVQKPLTHDIWEARVLTDAAKRYQVVTQMGNQGASNDGPRLVREWIEAGLIGDVHTVYCWSNRPSWPQGRPWPSQTAAVPGTLDWELWLGTAPRKDYVDKLVPFNWRGWWDYGTGALGDMGCHMLEVPFSALGLQYVENVKATVGTSFNEAGQLEYFPESCPASSYAVLTFPKTARTTGPVKLYWMDGGIQPERPDELQENEPFGDGGNGTLIVGTKGKIVSDTYGDNARLLPTSRMIETKNVKPQYARVEGQAGGHYRQWVEACLAGYGNKDLSAPFEISGPLTEALLMANLAIRGAGLKGDGSYPMRNRKLLWEHQQMKVSNYDELNAFVRRQYPQGWEVNYRF